ncbi:MAG TPA: hypothetical protein VHW00_25125 [Thermoanaerobaculia bacterium]|nr:hypothetical protein [Thermoanaerobaculia bacterium]
MTHGDKTKAKTVKSSKASGQQKNGGEAKAVAEKGGNGKSGHEAKAGSKASPQSPPAKEVSKAGGIKGLAGGSEAAKKPAAAKGGKAAATEKSSGEKRGRAPLPAPSSSDPFTNPVVADSFSRAIQKYPNAFRKLTD